jgi:hypothetical protein
MAQEKNKPKLTAEEAAKILIKESGLPEKTAPQPPASPPLPKEKLLAFRAITSFSDGNLREFMEQYGYSCEWQMNEVRKLPGWLIKRCMQSGAELDRADGG